MSDAIWLDALFPPSPDDLLKDMQEAGADAVAVYVLRRNAAGGLLNTGSWTRDHVSRVRAAGKYALPIVVPGNRPSNSDWGDALDRAHALGIPTSAIVVDIETFSLPPDAWVRGFRDHARGAGWKVLRYGDVNVLANYAVADGDWISHGAGILVRSGSYRPAPAVPRGTVADQYAVDVIINGHAYDVSVALRSLLGSVGDVGSGSAVTSAQEHSMGNNIRLPDLNSEAGLFDVVLEESTHQVYWGFQAGGEGAEEGLSDQVNPVPNASDGPVKLVPGTMEAFIRKVGGVTRVTISGRRETDDKAWEIVLHGESPWEVLSPWARRQLNVTIAAGVPGPKGDPGPPAKVGDVIAEIARKLSA